MDVDEMLSKVETILSSAAKLALKERKVCTKSKPKKKKWFDKDCDTLRREVLRLGRKLCRSKVTHEQRLLFFKRKREFKKKNGKG